MFSRGNSEASIEGKTERNLLMGVSYLTVREELGKLVEEGGCSPLGVLEHLLPLDYEYRWDQFEAFLCLV